MILKTIFNIHCQKLAIAKKPSSIAVLVLTYCYNRSQESLQFQDHFLVHALLFTVFVVVNRKTMQINDYFKYHKI